mmetsp:Transcript_33473/g.88658  ORF Transcript_33473/g.88658 Transcript_33473/m.88658 type:complete len:212 (+) Transcript_33473:854-1489(+)
MRGVRSCEWIASYRDGNSPAPKATSRAGPRQRLLSKSLRALTPAATAKSQRLRSLAPRAKSPWRRRRRLTSTRQSEQSVSATVSCPTSRSHTLQARSRSGPCQIQTMYCPCGIYIVRPASCLPWRCRRPRQRRPSEYKTVATWSCPGHKCPLSTRTSPTAPSPSPTKKRPCVPCCGVPARCQGSRSLEPTTLNPGAPSRLLTGTMLSERRP